jgi:hypothetical protein
LKKLHGVLSGRQQNRNAGLQHMAASPLHQALPCCRFRQVPHQHQKVEGAALQLAFQRSGFDENIAVVSGPASAGLRPSRFYVCARVRSILGDWSVALPNVGEASSYSKAIGTLPAANPRRKSHMNARCRFA